jgi:diguanylate cyclase (GGDEF)-like protein
LDLTDKLELLRRTDFLSLLPDEVLRLLVEQSREIPLDGGEVLFGEGDEGRNMYVVLTGELVVHKGEKQIASGGPGSYYGEMALIESKKRSASVKALRSSTLLEITEEQFNQHVTANPAALLAMMRTISNRSRHDLETLDSDFQQLKGYAAELDQIRRQLLETNQQLERLSTLDTLTGLANRRRFDESLRQEWRRAARDGVPLSLLFCDIDFFKGYNDSYGHLAGDECLVRVAEVLRSTFNRPGDLAARYGGEEFVLILADTNEEGAVRLAEKLRTKIESLAIPHRGSPIGSRLTISLGVATVVPTPRGGAEELIARADAALYAAKQEGRNRVRTSRLASGAHPS